MKERLTALSPTLLVIFLLLSAVSVNAQCPPDRGTPYRGCSACGKVLSVRAQRDNLLKNRDQKAEQVIALSLKDIRDPKRDGSFAPDMAVEVTGYVAGVVSGGVKETANCGRPDLRNLRMLIVASPNEARNATKYVIFEITPRWQKNFGWDDSNFRLLLENAKNLFEGKWVTFRGWMFYNYSFVDEAQSTNPGIGDVWRATPWEVHPVTSYTILAGPPESAIHSQNGRTIPTISRSMHLLGLADAPSYSEARSFGWEKTKIHKNHATALMLGECLGECVDFYKDKCAECRAKPKSEKPACYQKAHRVRDECRLACVEQ